MQFYPAFKNSLVVKKRSATSAQNNVSIEQLKQTGCRMERFILTAEQKEHPEWKAVQINANRLHDTHV